MKWMLCSALLTGLSTWGSDLATRVSAAEEPVKVVATPSGGNAQVFVVATQGEGEDHPSAEADATVKVIVNDDCNGQGPVKIVRRIGGNDPMAFAWTAASGDRMPANLLMAHDEASEDSGWLGIQFGGFSEVKNDEPPVSGITVINVAKDSPAAAAGFAKDDKIVEVNDVSINDLGDLVQQIRDAGAGKRIKFTVTRDGARHTLVATLARRGDVKDIEWQYEGGGEVHFGDAVKARVKMMKRGENGEWTLENLHGADLIKVLPENIGQMLPSMGSHTISVTANNDDEELNITVVRDGDTTTIERAEGGAITVTHIDGDTGEKTTNTYANAEELAAADEEASQIYSNAQKNVVIDLNGEGHENHFFTFKLDGDDDDDADDDGEYEVWATRIEEQVKDSTEALAETMERLKNIRIEVAPGEDGAGQQAHTFFRYMHGQAQRTIRENPDGTIDLVVRKGGDELVTRYSGAADLQKRDADAYGKYMELKSSEK